MLAEFDGAVTTLFENYTGWVEEHEALNKLTTIETALDNLLDVMEEHAAELQNSPHLRAAIRAVCEASGRAGGLAVMV